MQIVCPNCATSYLIADTAIGANGRSVRCVRCQTVWQATPPVMAARDELAENPAADETVAAFRAALDGEPPEPLPALDVPDEAPAEPWLDDIVDANASEDVMDPAAEAPPEPLPMALADIPIPVEDAPPLVPGMVTHVTSLDDNGPPDIESVAARRARTTARRRRNRLRIPLPIAIVALATLCVALLGWRKDVVRHAPQLASFYSAIGLPVNLRGLTFTDMKIGNEIHDGVPVLVVEGMIVSTVSKPIDVPRLRFALRSATGAEVYSWTAQPSQPVLGAFETMPFRSRLASPPAEGHDIEVRFFTRRDAVAGLR
jgi:predicted Zn finger-like uncharacterized protein